MPSKPFSISPIAAIRLLFALSRAERNSRGGLVVQSKGAANNDGKHSHCFLLHSELYSPGGASDDIDSCVCPRVKSEQG